MSVKDDLQAQLEANILEALSMLAEPLSDEDRANRVLRLSLEQRWITFDIDITESVP